MLTATPSTGNNNAPLTSTDFNATSQANAWGTVYFGLRIRYVGPAQLMQGSMYCIETPRHNSLDNGTTTVSQAIAGDGVLTLPITNEWTTLCWSGPARTEEMSYNSLVTQAGGSGTFSLAFLIEAVTDPLAQLFVVEYSCGFELVGNSARGAQYSEQKAAEAAEAQEKLYRRTAGKPLVDPKPSQVPGVIGGSGMLLCVIVSFC